MWQERKLQTVESPIMRDVRTHLSRVVRHVIQTLARSTKRDWEGRARDMLG
jgi:hypothetical protein